MFQLNFTFDIIIYPRRVTISESFYLIRYEITENFRFDRQFYGINISFLIVPN